MTTPRKLNTHRINSVFPTQNYLRIRLDEPETQSKGGILLPDQAKDRVTSGVILEAGEGIYKEGTFVKTKLTKGQHVVFNQFALTDGRTFEDQAIISEDDVLGIILEVN